MDTGFQGFRKACEIGIMLGWLIQLHKSGGCGTRTRSRDFVRNPRCAVSSVIRRRASLPLFDAQKNDLRLLRSRTVWLVRPQDATGAKVRDAARFLRRPSRRPG